MISFPRDHLAHCTGYIWEPTGPTICRPMCGYKDLRTPPTQADTETILLMETFTIIELPEEAPRLALERAKEGQEQVTSELVDYLMKTYDVVCVEQAVLETQLIWKDTHWR